MGRLVTQRRDITGGSQFAGTEFSAQSSDPTRKALKLIQGLLQMGTESKTWRFVVLDADGTQVALIQQSTDAMGDPAANTDESVILRGPDIEIILAPGQQVQIITGSATNAMVGTLYFEEVDFS